MEADFPAKNTRPFQIDAAESSFTKPFVKISKVGNHSLADDCPINWKLYCFLIESFKIGKGYGKINLGDENGRQISIK